MRLVQLTEIVKGHEQRDRTGMVLNLLENALVSRVKRRICMRMVRLLRST
jgi:hypothetical protein